MPVKTDAVVSIELSDEERDSGVLTDLHLFDAIDAFFKDGVVVLANAIPTDVVDKLNERMTADTEFLLKRDKNIHWSQGPAKGNMAVTPPIEKEFLFPELYANKPASAVLTNLLGPKPELRFIQSNTSVPRNTGRQRIHKDCRFEHLSHPYGIVMNVTLIDVGPHNGATELWLGTHNSSPPEDWVSPGINWQREDVIEERRKIRPPVQATIKKGGLVLRDMRLWHCGVPNPSDDIRVMVAFVYFAKWYKNPMKQQLPIALKETFEKLGAINDTLIPGEWVSDDSFKYLDSEFRNDFSSSVRPEPWERVKHVELPVA